MAWERLAAEAERLKRISLRDLFSGDSGRFDQLSIKSQGILIDFSKEKIDNGALSALFDLAKDAGVEERRAAMFSGARINVTEDRAVLHAALRDGAGETVHVDDEDVMPAVRTERDRMLGFAEDVRAGRYRTASNEAFTDVINIGIGGSDLGPAMAVQALAPWHDGPRVHFVSNVDGAHLADAVRALDPARTLVIVASKTFTTLETMTNARSARNWLERGLGSGYGRHLAAVSTNLTATKDFGIDDDRVFGFWDWVGGRYSVWSSIGLPLAIAIGRDAFRAFLTGAAEMDRHFQEVPLAQNLPVLVALIGIWRRNAMGWPAVAIIPYDQRLARFPAYFQQLDMESNGKRVTAQGSSVPQGTGPLVFGEPGTNAQHSFFQLLHQGTDVIPVDFLVPARPVDADQAHHDILVASALAQSAALALGKTEDEVRAEMTAAGKGKAEIDRLAPHRTFPGDRPSTVILYERLDPAMLGRLIALFEHKIFVQGVIWGINSFDQWGVELGKALTNDLMPALAGAPAEAFDGSTRGLIAALRALTGGRAAP